MTKPTKNNKAELYKRILHWLVGLVNPLILLGYVFIIVLISPMNARDPAGPKFLALAILNLGAFVFLMFRKEQQPPLKTFSSFFSTRIGFLYGLFLAVSLLSFLKAVNPAESLLAFTKLFTVFTAVLIIAAILRVNTKYLTPVAVGMSLLLMADAANVFYQMWVLVEKYPNFADLYLAFANEVTSGYSNKNILASALFVKLPFALWLWTFRKGLAKILGLVATFAGFIALLPLGSRAFYLGLALLTAAYMTFIIIRILVDSKSWKTVLFSLAIVALIPLFSYLGWLGLSRVFPAAQVFNLKDRINERLSTIRQDISAGTRTVSWGRSVKLIKENPLLGVGAGNWKINVMKYENQTSPDYIYYYYNHNDFLQTTAETGIVGGLLFLSLFLTVWWAFLHAMIKSPTLRASSELPATQTSGELPTHQPSGELPTHQPSGELPAHQPSGELPNTGVSCEYLFIPAFGLLCYSVDAFFNFPFDRPEIQSLFAIFLGAAIAFSPEWKFFKGNEAARWRNYEIWKTKKVFLVTRHVSRVTHFLSRVTHFLSRVTLFLLPSLMILALLSSIYLLYLNFRSLRLQGLAAYELSKGDLIVTSSVIMAGFPAIPTLSIEGMPIAVIKARYLLNERKFAEAIELLKRENPSPWETHREYFISIAYKETGNSDSAIVYAMKVFIQKPLYTDNRDTLCRMLERLEKYEEAANILDDYLKALGQSHQGYIEWQADLRRKATIQRVEMYYYPGQYQFERKNYREAAGFFTKIIEKEPKLMEAWEKRAWCYYYLNENKKCLADIDHLLDSGVKNPGLEDIRKKVAKSE